MYRKFKLNNPSSLSVFFNPWIVVAQAMGVVSPLFPLQIKFLLQDFAFQPYGCISKYTDPKI